MQQLHEPQLPPSSTMYNNPNNGITVASAGQTSVPATATTSTMMGYTSTTAPGIVFATRTELAEHYKSDWHRYNLKRREAGLPMLFLHDFQTRLQAAAAVKAAQENVAHTGTDHLKHNKNNNNKKVNKQKKNQQNENPQNQQHVIVSQVSAYEQIKKDNEIRKQQQEQEQVEVQEQSKPDAVPDVPEITTNSEEVTTFVQPIENDTVNDGTTKEVTFAETDMDPMMGSTDVNTNKEEDDEEIMIDPRQSLFDRTVSHSVTENISRMYKRYGFFVPDQEYIIDMEGLIGYCHEKIMLGHTCLYCQRIFPTVQSCKQHMIDTNHTKLRYEPDIDLDELAVFYDFTTADNEFIQHTMNQQQKSKKQSSKGNGENDDDEEWEDASDDEAMDEDAEGKEEDDDDDDDDDDEMYDGYQREIANLGWDITPLGELVFPDGRIIGHRALRRYYQQRPQPQRSANSDAVTAARLGAQERLYRGNVYTLTNDTNNASGSNTSSRGSTLAMLRANGNSNAISSGSANLLKQNGIRPGTVSGRVGKGILVPTTSSATGAVSYSQLSVYRYRAAVKKQRRMEMKGQKIQQKQQLNMNHMDKKHNNIMNGVSVQHALR